MTTKYAPWVNQEIVFFLGMIFPANNEITATPTFCRAWKIEVSSLILTDLGIYLGQSQSQNTLYLYFHPWRLYLSKNLSPTIITNLFYPRQFFWEVVPELSVFYNNKVWLMSQFWLLALHICELQTSLIPVWRRSLQRDLKIYHFQMG